MVDVTKELLDQFDDNVYEVSVLPSNSMMVQARVDEFIKVQPSNINAVPCEYEILRHFKFS